jgi:uncharacterized protein YgiM (DUF1202 family)
MCFKFKLVNMRMKRSINCFIISRLKLKLIVTRLTQIGLALLLVLGLSPKPSVVFATLPYLPMDNCPPLGNEIAQVMVDVDSTLARSAPRWDAPVATRLIKFQCFYAVGKDSKYGFLLVREGNAKVWVHGNDVRFRGNLDALPITDEVFTAQTSVVRNPPAGLPAVSARVRQIYANAASYGRNPNAVTVIGDCNSESAVYFGRATSGGFSVYSYPSLVAVYQRFEKSFLRNSVATSGSFNTSAAFDNTWADPSQCSNDAPFACELRLSRASIVVISLGTGDQHRWRDFDGQYRRIIDYALSQGVVPVLMTKADELEFRQGGAPQDYINGVVRRLGNEYGLPVIDLHTATRTLPNNGLANEPPPQFHLSEEGMDMRMVMTLLTLHQIVYGYAPSLSASAPAPAPTVSTPAPAAQNLAAASVSSSSPSQTSASYQSASGTFRVNAPAINIRNAPTTNGAIIGSARNGQSFSVVGRSNDNAWVYVYNPLQGYGWMFAALGTLSDSTATASSSAPNANTTNSATTSIAIRIAAANVRSGPGTDNSVVGVAYGGRNYDIVGRNSDSTWVKINFTAVGDAWIYAPLGNINGTLSDVRVEE